MNILKGSLMITIATVAITTATTANAQLDVNARTGTGVYIGNNGDGYGVNTNTRVRADTDYDARYDNNRRYDNDPRYHYDDRAEVRLETNSNNRNIRNQRNDVDLRANNNVSFNDIRTVQDRLNSMGYRVSVDGKNGPRTRAAVRAYQKNNNIYPSGEINTATINSLGRANVNNQSYRSNARVKSDTRISNNYNFNAREITAIQTGLRNNGYRVGIDGVMGANTRAALRDFQSRNRLNVSGNIDADTASALNVHL